MKDINSGGWKSDSNPSWLTGVGGTLYFAAKDGEHGYELWRTDGSKTGTAIVKDLHRGDRGSNPAWIMSHRGTLFFRAKTPATGHELWKVTPTDAWS